MKRVLLGLLSALAMLASAHAAYPDRPIRFVVAFAPGSSTDIVARLLGERLRVSLGQPVMNAAADGYWLLFHSVAFAVNPPLFSNAGYDALTDLQPVAMTAVTPNLIYVSGQVPIASTSMPPAMPFGPAHGARLHRGRSRQVGATGPGDRPAATGHADGAFHAGRDLA